MNETALYIAAALFLGIAIGRGQQQAKPAGTDTASVTKPADWWTFAGSWAA